MKNYVIGIDYGTLSARAVLVDLENGAEVAAAESVYAHAVIERTLNGNIPLESTDALQHPQDYLDALGTIVRETLAQAQVPAEQVKGVGLDFTACTMLPLDENHVPLCFKEEFKNEPQAYVKLWKHHSAQPQADRITALARETNEPWLAPMGGKISSEWLFPKMLETLEKAPKVYEKAACFAEAADWLVWLLTGTHVRSASFAGFKAMWMQEYGYPTRAFLERLNPQFADVVEAKLAGEVKPVGTVAGVLSKEGAQLIGLCEGTVLSVPQIDAHAGLPAAGVVNAGKMMIIMGTSNCHILQDNIDKGFAGLGGKMPNGIVPNLVAYEMGQACMGDLFGWFVKNGVPASYKEQADDAGISVFDYLEREAAKIGAGENRLIALDWWNGNRSPYNDTSLTGAVFGYTMSTTPTEIYRALLEATAFGTKVIVDRFVQNGIRVDEICAGGGIPLKNPLLMQIFADVLGREIQVSDCKQAGALGSAIIAAAACGAFASVQDAADRLAKACSKVYVPNLCNTEKYRKPYEKYVQLSELFANDKASVLHQPW